jgi:hypothetical protein
MAKKFFLLTRPKGSWEEYKSFVVCANDEADARLLAHAASYPEDYRRDGADPEDRLDWAKSNQWVEEWLDPAKCTCQILDPEATPSGVVHSYFKHG